MSDESSPGSPGDQPAEAPTEADAVTEWVAGALDKTSQAESGSPRSAPQGPGDSPSQSADAGGAAIEAGVASMLGQVADAGSPQKRRSRLWRAVWYVVGLIVLVAILSVILEFTGVWDELSCDSGQETESTVQDAQQPSSDQPQSPEHPTTPYKPPSQGQAVEDPYLEGRAALALPLTPPDSVSRYNTGSGPLRYAFTWLDTDGSALGSIGTVVFTRDDVFGDGGRVTIEGSDAIGAYTMGKPKGVQNVQVDFAIRIPGPDGGEPQLIVFNTENTASFTLTGTAQPVGGAEPKPKWRVTGTQIR